MKARFDSIFSDFTLCIGNSEKNPMKSEDIIKIPNEMLIKYDDDENLEDYLINNIFPSLKKNAHLVEYITQQPILQQQMIMLIC